MSAPRVAGTTVRELLEAGEGAAIVDHALAGVMVLMRPDVEDPDVIVLATYDEVFGLVRIAGQRDVSVATMIRAREARAYALAAA